MTLRSKVENRINIIFPQGRLHLNRGGDITLHESEIRARIKTPCVIQRSAVIELIERDNVIVGSICEGEVADEPAGAVDAVLASRRFASRGDEHEPGAAGNEDVFAVF